MVNVLLHDNSESDTSMGIRSEINVTHWSRIVLSVFSGGTGAMAEMVMSDSDSFKLTERRGGRKHNQIDVVGHPITV